MLKKIRLLLVDDDEIDREMICKALQPLDAEITEVSSCKDYFNSVDEKEYDLVLLDFKLPDGDGITAAKKVRLNGVTSPTILITGFGSEELHKQSIEAGLLGYITKDNVTPYKIMQLIIIAFSQYRVEIEKVKKIKAEEELKRLALLERLEEINGLLKIKIEFYDKLNDLATVEPSESLE